MARAAAAMRASVAARRGRGDRARGSRRAGVRARCRASRSTSRRRTSSSAEALAAGRGAAASRALAARRARRARVRARAELARWSADASGIAEPPAERPAVAARGGRPRARAGCSHSTPRAAGSGAAAVTTTARLRGARGPVRVGRRVRFPARRTRCRRAADGPTRRHGGDRSASAPRPHASRELAHVTRVRFPRRAHVARAAAPAHRGAGARRAPRDARARRLLRLRSDRATA